MIEKYKIFLENNQDNESNFYYHSIPINLLETVLKHGLKGSIPTSGRLKDEQKYMDDDSSEDAPANKERIYLSYDYDDIMKYENGYAILTIHENGINNLEVYPDFQWDGIYVTSKNKNDVSIEPKHIKMFKIIKNE